MSKMDKKEANTRIKINELLNESRRRDILIHYAKNYVNLNVFVEVA